MLQQPANVGSFRLLKNELNKNQTGNESTKKITQEKLYITCKYYLYIIQQEKIMKNSKPTPKHVHNNRLVERQVNKLFTLQHQRPSPY